MEREEEKEWKRERDEIQGLRSLSFFIIIIILLSPCHIPIVLKIFGNVN